MALSHRAWIQVRSASLQRSDFKEEQLASLRRDGPSLCLRLFFVSEKFVGCVEKCSWLFGAPPPWTQVAAAASSVSPPVLLFCASVL